ncbi:MFS transporter [Billgrantia tianxiuensis]|uniref:MFS transporter n=1 Tax=Billgrantia tianxiuensis TaxID=2497861 RepID=UPI002413E46F|nr:MFS transporter [Halomonas tianxiuensis]
MALGVFGLVTAEFLPASLLTPMAADLGVTEGMAGQAVTVTAAVALLTSLLISTATRRIDRRHVLLGFSMLLVASNLMVAFAPNLTVLLIGRVLLGMALGGFWTMSIATMMRLVPEDLVPRGCRSCSAEYPRRPSLRRRWEATSATCSAGATCSAWQHCWACWRWRCSS